MPLTMAFSATNGGATKRWCANGATGWTLTMQGQARSGLLEMRQGLIGCTDLGLRVFEPYLKAAIADAHHDVGEALVGLALLDEAILFAEETKVRFWDAELLR